MNSTAEPHECTKLASTACRRLRNCQSRGRGGSRLPGGVSVVRDAEINDHSFLQEVRSMARITGTVKWFNDAKGYGFL